MSLNEYFKFRAGFSVMLPLVAFILLFVLKGLPTAAKEPTVAAGVPQSGLREVDVALGEQIYRVEIAATPEQAQKGLMFRKELPKRHGMLFLFQPGRVVQFWMKNTYIPLDIVFLSQGRVTYIAKDVPPCRVKSCPTYGPSTQSDMVVELPAGTAERDQLEPGDIARVALSQGASPSPKTTERHPLEAASFQLER